MTKHLAYVKWHDAMTEEASGPSGTVVPELAVLEEIGWLLGESPDAITIGMELEHNASPGRWRLHIPRGQIKELRIFTLPRKRSVAEKPHGPAPT